MKQYKKIFFLFLIFSSLFPSINQFITTPDSTHLWTESFGDIENPIVLLIGGAGTISTSWPNIFCQSLVDAGFFVVRYDHRDTGYSTHTPPGKTYSLETLTEDAWAIIRTYGKTNAHLIGFSMGGYMTAMMATQKPDAILSATIMGAGPTYNEKGFSALGIPPLSTKINAVLENYRPTGNKKQDFKNTIELCKALNGEYSFDQEMIEEYLLEMDTRNGKRSEAAGFVLNHITALRSMPVTLPFKNATSRALVIHGTLDWAAPIEHGQKLAELLPNATFFPIEKLGHQYLNRKLWTTLLTPLIINHIKGN